ncbi:MAG: MaoC family dehydratase N-terminal domain-containing protein [Candidatus Rokubacteria bacterium]|nr:MaoC family dehydratase N-terminal domain-containing protein [Candidatus Rokubacteria bacterium]
MATTELDLDAIRSHIGRRSAAADVITPGPANLLRLTLSRPEPELREGDALPPGWHKLYFLPRYRPDGLHADGTPKDAGVIPPMPLPRRMFAGESVRYHRPLRIGEAVRGETELTDISAKTGGTGTLVFATAVHRIFGADGLAIEEERRTVFREEIKAGDRNQAPRRDPAPTDVPWRHPVEADAVLLFRFSALTFNSHRIHYDRKWAMEVEGYPGLVVHGPLASTLLIDFARDHAGGRAIRASSAQARAPLFDTAAFELRGRPTDTGCEVWTVTPEGTIAMAMSVDLA